MTLLPRRVTLPQMAMVHPVISAPWRHHAQVGVAPHIEPRMHEAELLRQIDILLQRADVRQQLRIAVIVNAGLRSRLGSRSPKRVSTMGLDASRPRRHHRHPVGEVDRFLHVMGDEDTVFGVRCQMPRGLRVPGSSGAGMWHWRPRQPSRRLR